MSDLVIIMVMFFCILDLSVLCLLSSVFCFKRGAR